MPINASVAPMTWPAVVTYSQCRSHARERAHAPPEALADVWNAWLSAVLGVYISVEATKANGQHHQRREEIRPSSDETPGLDELSEPRPSLNT